MEHRQHRVEDLLAVLGVLHPGLALQGIGVEIEMGEHRPLGMPGGAGGVLDHRQVLDRGPRHLGVDGAVGQQPAPRQGVLRRGGQRVPGRAQLLHRQP
ncbi:hypothetical protein SDC9_207083 [bioreactor metagenome]|uniref:Uncharacterized protein n=1 Tax=bioreactor metagenome TaxID=1076179 RepID=A0A645J8A8_9ZZZZ